MEVGDKLNPQDLTGKALPSKAYDNISLKQTIPLL